ncbi:hypothetical protein K501DRAFT_26966 [Backusella circina FSU 941]|nr:hypothetical protein K501DRAFT_26966 [Backusella circina FSU 941]
MSRTPGSPIDRPKRSRFGTKEWDSDDEDDHHEERHPKRQAIPDPETKAPYFNTKESNKPRRKEKNAIQVKQEETDGSISLRSVVDTKDAGAIIGKGGKNINEIRDVSTAQITMSKIVQGVHERILTVNGSIHSISRAYGLLGERIQLENAQSSDDKKHERSTVSIKLLIPNDKMGNLIGKSGNVIKSIQEQSFARLDASENPLPMSNERTVTIQGTPFSIEQAVYLIVEILMNNTKKQTRVIHYKPNSKDNMKDDTKDDTKDDRKDNRKDNRKDSRKDNRKDSRKDNRKDSRKDNRKDSRKDNTNNNTNNNRQVSTNMNRSVVMMDSGGMIPMNAVPMNAVPMNMGQFYYPSNNVVYDGMMMNVRQNISTMMTPQTQRIYVPKEMVGCVIGKRGSKINEIRQMSGSEIKIDSPNESTSERLITINGTAESNQVALYMLYSTLDAEKSRLGIS